MQRVETWVLGKEVEARYNPMILETMTETGRRYK